MGSESLPKSTYPPKKGCTCPSLSSLIMDGSEARMLSVILSDPDATAHLFRRMGEEIKKKQKKKRKKKKKKKTDLLLEQTD